MVVAGSFSETYKRNAINNGFLVIEAPDLIRDLKAQFSDQSLSVRTGINVTIDFAQSILRTAEKSYPFGAVGAAAQELIVSGGLESWVKQQLNF